MVRESDRFILSPENRSPDHPARQLQLECSHAPAPASSAPARPPFSRPKTDSHRTRPLRSGRKNLPPNLRSAPPSRSTNLITSASPIALRQLSSTIRLAAATASRSLVHSSPCAHPSPCPSRFVLSVGSILIIMVIMVNLFDCKPFQRASCRFYPLHGPGSAHSPKPCLPEVGPFVMINDI